MNKIILLLLLALCCNCSRGHAQNVDSAIRYVDTTIRFDSAVGLKMQIFANDTTDTTEGGYRAAYFNWANFISSRVSNNAPQGTDRMAVANVLMTQAVANFPCTTPNSQIGAANWKLLGPDLNSYCVPQGSTPTHITENSGRIECLYSLPYTVNGQTVNDGGHLLAGSNSGGLWKTVDRGQNWANITDHSPNILPGTTGIHSIAVNPLYNSWNTIYLATGKPGIEGSDAYGYSTGVVYSNDGGTSWSVDNGIDQLLTPGTPFNPLNTPNVIKMAYKPGTEELYLITDQQIALSPTHMGSSSNWQLLVPPSGTVQPYYSNTSTPPAIPSHSYSSVIKGIYTDVTDVEKDISTTTSTVKQFSYCDIQFSIQNPGTAIIGANYATTTSVTSNVVTTTTVRRYLTSNNSFVSTLSSHIGPVTYPPGYANTTYTSYLIEYTLSSNTWHVITIPYAKQLTSITVANTDNVYLNLVDPAVQASNGSITSYSHGNLAVMVLSTSAFSMRNSSFNSLVGPFQHIAISPNNENVLYSTCVGGPGVYLSEGTSSTLVGAPGTTNLASGGCHDDARCITFATGVSAASSAGHDPTYYDVVIAGTDGGVIIKPSGRLNFWSMVGKGLVITQFYGFDNSEVNGDMIEGGAQDNGDNAYMKNRTAQWIAQTLYGDGYDTKFNRMTNTNAYCELNWPGFYGYQFIPASNYSSTIGGPSNIPTDFVPGSEQYLGGGVDNTGASLACPNFAPCSVPIRPLYVNPANTVFMGAHHLFYLDNTNNWSRVFNTDPKDHLPAPVDYTIDHIQNYILPENTDYQNVAYILYGRSSGQANGDPTGNPDNKWAKLFMSQNVTRTPTSTTLYTEAPTLPTTQHTSANFPWVNITPKINGFVPTEVFQANSIVTDPQNPARIWIAFGNADFGQIGLPDNQRTNRVWYSSDYGLTWHDVSAGLPPISINKLLYQNTGQDIIFAGTDAGVFVWDPNKINTYNNQPGMWTCWNTGLPGPMIVTDMKFNYCEGKLRIATYGRGMWETNMLSAPPSTTIPSTTLDPNIGDIVLYPSDIIDGTNTTGGIAIWSTDHWPLTGVRVKSGYTLEIEGSPDHLPGPTIHMPKNGSIYVEPGATLIVSYATITNDCGGLWKGILAVGNSNLPQTAANQASVRILNSLIENARVGVTNCAESYPGANTSGGIIQTWNSTFQNNRRGLAFAPYHNNNGLVHAANVSTVFNTTFTVDDNYRGTAYNYLYAAGITMSNVEGVNIYGSTFQNQMTAPATVNTGVGIDTWDAGFNLIHSCTSTTTGCALYSSAYKYSAITGFNVGVQCNGDNLNPTDAVMIDHVNFDKNGLGVYANAINTMHVYYSNFTIGDALRPYLTTCNCEKGVYTKDCQHFRVEENAFTGVHSTYSTYGVETDHTGANANQVYENQFNSLTYGCHAININSRGTAAYYPPYNVTNDIGLEYWCNAFSNNLISDIHVGDNSAYNINPSNINNFISKTQGNPGITTHNTFRENAAPLYSGRIELNIGTMAFPYWNLPYTINYYYNNTTANEKAIPGYPVTVTSVSNVNAIPISNLNKCGQRIIISPSPTGDGGSSTSKAVYEQAIQTSVDNYLVANAALSAKIDGGNTAALLNTVTTATDVMALHDQLLTVSPYVSEPVLVAVGSLVGMPQELKTDVFKANPTVIRDSGFISYLQTGVEPPFSSDLIDTLNNYMGVVTSRDSDEANVDSNYQNMVLNASYLYATLKMDTLGIDHDTMNFWYHQLPVLWTRYECAGMYLGLGMYDSMTNVMNRILTEFSMTGDSLNEYNAYADFYNLLVPVLESGKTDHDLDSSGLVTLQGIAARGAGYGSAAAASLYSHIMQIPTYTCQPDAPSGKSTGLSNTLPSKAKENKVQCYPNPAKDHVTFTYNVAKPDGNLILSVSNTLGQTMYETTLKNKVGLVTWDTKNAASGNYFYKLRDSKNVYGSGTVSVVK